ncbi:nascent polypeptide-associated complex protein [Candidatus Woesearchaeota archaeon]|nr:nascent polypeptide-associated complex protein [Candidatus Woesearchaeota archaeon]
MFPGMNPKQMAKAMKKLGIQQNEIDALAVIIRTRKEDIIIRNPSVSKVNMMGTWTYQVSGEEEHRPLKEEEQVIPEEDIKTVMTQTKCTKPEALEALKNSKGDLAEAIISLNNK